MSKETQEHKELVERALEVIRAIFDDTTVEADVVFGSLGELADEINQLISTLEQQE